jgi:ATP-binding cassette subfamily B protein
MFIIAHGLATIQYACQTLVVEAGRIAQQGTHAELSRQEGVYRRFLAIRQAAEGWSIALSDHNE